MRFLGSIALGVVMAFVLFLIMHALVSNNEGFERSDDAGKLIDFVRVRPEEMTIKKEREVPKKPPPPKKNLAALSPLWMVKLPFL